MSDWQSGSGRYYCNDITDFKNNSQYWWAAAQVLGLTPADFVKFLVENYKPDHISFNNNILVYSWNKEHYNKCHSFVLYVNKIARDRQFLI